MFQIVTPPPQFLCDSWSRYLSFIIYLGYWIYHFTWATTNTLWPKPKFFFTSSLKLLYPCGWESAVCNSLWPPWTITHQPPLSMGLSQQEYWSGYHFLLQGPFPTWGLNPCFYTHLRPNFVICHEKGNYYWVIFLFTLFPPIILSSFCLFQDQMVQEWGKEIHAFYWQMLL